MHTMSIHVQVFILSVAAVAAGWFHPGWPAYSRRVAELRLSLLANLVASCFQLAISGCQSHAMFLEATEKSHVS